MVGDGEVHAEFFEFIIVEFSGIVRDNNLGNPESTDDVFSYEISNISFCNFGERFHFYPLGKVLNGDDQEFYL